MSTTNDLNPEQRAAVEHSHGPLLVLAGAGSGKTRVITERIAHLIQRRGVAPPSILAVTFTNKAANEMRKRVIKRVGAEAKKVTLSTFHSLGLTILRKHGHRLGYQRHFTIYSESDQQAMVRTLLREHPHKREKFDPGILLSRISTHKNRLTTGDAPVPLFNDKYDMVFEDIFDRYQNGLRACQAVDFDDLILLPITLFRQNLEVLQHMQEHYKHILVDEYQDTNAGQYTILRLLASKCDSLCVVGDDDQSIYGWRGAEVGNILRFEKDYPNSTVVTLKRNYRSTQIILDAAYHVIVNNAKRQDKRLHTVHGRGRNIDAFIAKDEMDEARTIAWRIQSIRERTHAPWSSFAVLYRSNLQSRALETTLRTSQIPYDVMGGYDFFERKEVKDILAYLKVVQNPNDDLSLLRIINYPRRGIGDTTVIHLHERAQEQGVSMFTLLKKCRDDEELPRSARTGIASFIDMIHGIRDLPESTPLEDVVRSTIQSSQYREELERTIDDVTVARIKVEMVEELASAAKAYADDEDTPTLSGFIDTLSLDDTPGERKKRRGDSVQLATLHSAKGLEFPYVFLCGMEEELFPHSRSLKELAGVDEERRLCYVGITRAQKHLTLSFANERVQFGKTKKRTPSRFLAEIPNELLCKQFSHSENFFDQQQPQGK